MAKKKAAGKKLSATPVEAIKHKDARVNIPTHELRDFVKPDELAPKTLRYPRDPSLDPQLVWKGKDEQDGKDLEVPVVPIYIQEKIHPQALVENLRETAKPGEAEPELSLFNDFNGIEEFDKKVDFYHHEGHWSNRMILGDSLLVMASLAEKEGLKGKAQCVYLDPPYGIRFGSNWQVSTRKRDVKDGKIEDASRQPEQVKAFRDTWQLGIHSYLSYLRDRLSSSRDLLTDSGSVFVQIGIENLHLVRSLMDETFGSENFVALIVVKKLAGVDSTYVPSTADFLLLYAKDYRLMKYRKVLLSKMEGDEGADRYDQVLLPDGSVRPLSMDERQGLRQLPTGCCRFQPDNIVGSEFRPDTTVPFEYRGKAYHPGPSSHWKTSLGGMSRLAAAGRLFVTSGASLRYVRMLKDFPATTVGNVWDDISGSIQSRTDPKVYVVQTSTAVVQRAILMTTDPGDLVLDPTCGSGTTAIVAEQWGRRWITIDTSRVALALARTRLMAAKFPYYLLADSAEGVAKEAEATGKVPPQHKTDGDIRKGFVYKRVPHVTLKSIANNPDIREGMSRAEVDAAIERHAETELLYDKPFEDNKRIRVTGPFTVESLSPHRVLAAEEERPRSEAAGQVAAASGRFEEMIIQNLRKAGVQNTKKGEKLVFTSLDLHAGQWIQAAGEYQEGGKTKRVAVSIGPEHGTVGPLQVKEAAKEAVKLYDTLIVCGFAFDPHVQEEARQYGNLVVLPAKMNPDLAMGDDLLKKTGAGNLFMIFGEPDLAITRTKDGKVQVEIKGVDVYDPTTGAIRSSSTDDIACWFLDTNYNGESFFVRHAYFTGAEEPYEKLQRALRAEIDEAAWRSLYATVSRPFAKPDSGKIAVKVINHYGDEVLKVMTV